MVRSNRITEYPERPSIPDLLNLDGFHRKIIEEWRFLDVIALFIPGV